MWQRGFFIGYCHFAWCVVRLGMEFKPIDFDELMDSDAFTEAMREKLKQDAAKNSPIVSMFEAQKPPRVYIREDRDRTLKPPQPLKDRSYYISSPIGIYYASGGAIERWLNDPYLKGLNIGIIIL